MLLTEFSGQVEPEVSQPSSHLDRNYNQDSDVTQHNPNFFSQPRLKKIANYFLAERFPVSDLGPFSPRSVTSVSGKLKKTSYLQN